MVARTLPSREPYGAAGHRRHLSASLGHDERARGDVPRLEPAFPESIEAAGRDVAEVERGRAQPTDGARAADERGEELDDRAGILLHVVMEAGDEQRVDERCAAEDTRSGAPFSQAPCPRSAVNSSRRFGS